MTNWYDSDSIGTWIELKMQVCRKVHSSAAALRCQINPMQYDLDMSMWDWITKVEELAHHLEDIKSPMIPIDIINTLTCDLPDSYTPFVVLINSLLDNLNYAADLATVQEVIKHLLNKEAWQAEANHIDIGPSTLLTRNHKKPTTCYNCGESGHLRFNCDLSPWEVRMCHEQKSHRLRQNGEEVKVAVHYAPESNSEDVPLKIY